jgi:hypothetical protein
MKRTALLATLAVLGGCTGATDDRGAIYDQQAVQLSEAEIANGCVAIFSDQLFMRNGIAATSGRLVAPPAGVVVGPNTRVVELSATAVGRPVIYRAFCLVFPDRRFFVSQG